MPGRSHRPSWSGSRWNGSIGSTRELNAFRKVFADKAMLEAEQAEARRSAGDKRPLLGVPIAIKDEIDVAGEINLHGTDAFETPAKADSEVVRRLREAGAIIVGLTLLPELAICGFTESATYGVTRNPWNPQRTPGGSSGGSGAAVAAGLVPIASAGDGAGSIRIPAACNGLFGLKPTRGRVSLAPRSKAGAGMAVEGCVSRSVIDTALWLDIVSGGSTEDEAPAPPAKPFVESVKDSPGKLRVGWSTLAPRAIAPPTVSDEVKQTTVAEAAVFLEGLGHEVSLARSRLGHGSATRSPRASSRASPRRSRKCRCRSASNGAPAASASSAASCPSRSTRKRWRSGPDEIARINAIFDDVDVLVMPVMGGTALPIRRWQGRGALHDRARDEPLLSLLRPLEPPRQRRDVGPLRLRRRRDAAGDPDHRPPRQRVAAALARRPDRGRAPLGRPAPPDLLAAARVRC